MRFNNRITLVKYTKSHYDPDKNGYVEKKEEATLPCKLSSLGIERTQELFGNMDKRVTIARLQTPYTDDVDHALINDKKYNVITSSDYYKGVLFLEGAF